MIDYTKFDAELMNQIAHTYKPFGFAYAIYEGATRKAHNSCLLYTSPSPRDGLLSRMPSSA